MITNERLQPSQELEHFRQKLIREQHEVIAFVMSVKIRLGNFDPELLEQSKETFGYLEAGKLSRVNELVEQMKALAEVQDLAAYISAKLYGRGEVWIPEPPKLLEEIPRLLNTVGDNMTHIEIIGGKAVTIEENPLKITEEDLK